MHLQRLNSLKMLIRYVKVSFLNYLYTYSTRTVVAPDFFSKGNFFYGYWKG